VELVTVNHECLNMIDATLMRCVAEGDRSALGELVRRHQQRVRSIAYRMTRRWDVADDIAQQTFLRVFHAAASYRPSAAFSTWLYRIVVNLCLDAARRPHTASLVDERESCSTADMPEKQLILAERTQAIAQEVAQLPERQRMVLILHRFEGLSHAQIAASTGWSVSSVESLLVRAYATLRQRLEEWRK
jgi:RNA polymerase sigma-70 factor, ECF subfamily